MSDALRDLARERIGPLVAYVAPAARPGIVKLDANESPWPLPDEARRRVAEAVSAIDFHRYPDARAGRLRARLAARFGGPEDAYVIGCGSDEVIALVVNALSRPRPGRAHAAILFPVPTFVMYRITALGHGVDPVEVPLGPGFALDEAAMRAALAAHRPNVVFLATPNNPTGNRYATETIEALARDHRDVLFVVDEAYVAFSTESLARLADRHENVGVMSTISKIGLAAARVGWARLPVAVAHEVDKGRQPFNLSTLAQTVGELALGELAPVLDAHVATILRERERLVHRLAAHPWLVPHPTAANFVLVSVQGPLDASELAAALAARDVWIKSFHAHGGALTGTVRITVGTPWENDALLDALEALRAGR
jgi:histidinol-phosphate aminotransferase